MACSRLILGDSLLRNVRHIKDCDVLSLSGVRLDELLEYVKSNPLLLENRESILILCGTNNIQKNTPENVLNKMKNLVEYLLSVNPRPQVIISAILPRPLDYATSHPIIKQINKELNRLCPRWGAKYIASFKLFIKYGRPVDDYYSDGLHLNANGTRRLRQFLSQRLAELGNKPSQEMSGINTYLKRSIWSNNLK
jgi:lysophospholipase L1-like esterase